MKKEQFARFLFVIGLTLTSLVGYTQGLKGLKKKTADDYYARYSYSKAAEIYKELAAKGEEDVVGKIAECYRKTGKSDSAEVWFAKWMASNNKQAVDVYHYSEVLKQNGKYSESDKWLKEYEKLAGDDSRTRRKLADPKYVERLSKDEGRYNVKHLEVNSHEADFGAIFWQDKVVFCSSREGVKSVKRQYNWDGKPFLDLYVADVSTDGGLSNPTLYHEHLKEIYHEGPAAFSPDGSTIYFTRNMNSQRKRVEGVNHLSIYKATYKDGKWIDESPFEHNNEIHSVGHPVLSADGNKMYFISDMPGGHGGTDIYFSTMNESGGWGKPQNAGDVINTEGNEMFPFLDAEGDFLFFASDGHHGLGGLDVYMIDLKGSEKVTNLGTPINTSKDDFAFVLDKEMKKGYFSSNREGGEGSDDLYSFDLLKPFKISYYVKGTVVDMKTSEKLPGAKVELKDKAGKVLEEITADEEGMYSFEIKPGQEYNVGGALEDYFATSKDFSSKNMGEATEVVVDLPLEKNPGISVYCLITDKKTGTPLEGVHLKITDNMTGKDVVEMHTSATGDYRKSLPDSRIGDRLSYNITIEKEGYLGKTVTFNHGIENPGEIAVHKELDIALDKVDVGTDIGKLIDIQPIYFDYRKFDIRPDAAIELDKIVKVLTENPTMVIELGSHTDCRGSKGYNAKLSDKRAKASATYIQHKIDNPSRIYGKGYGETKIMNGCECEGAVKSDCSEDEHSANRRTEFKIVKM